MPAVSQSLRADIHFQVKVLSPVAVCSPFFRSSRQSRWCLRPQRQVITGSAFLPLEVRVTDSSIPPNSVLGASVAFQSTVLRPAGNDFMLVSGDSGGASAGMSVILGPSQSSILTDSNGFASVLPSVGSFTGPLEVEIQVSAAVTASLRDELEIYPVMGGGNTFSSTSSRGNGSVPAGRGL